LVERLDARAQAAPRPKPEGRRVTPETIVERFLVKHAKVHLNAGSSYGFGGPTTCA